MSGRDPARLIDRLVGTCFALLLAAMALYGAVQIVRSIWPALAMGAGAVGLGAVIWWLAGRRRY
jgi:hypothetical protein